jgi:hypothetical protein
MSVLDRIARRRLLPLNKFSIELLNGREKPANVISFTSSRLAPPLRAVRCSQALGPNRAAMAKVIRTRNFGPTRIHAVDAPGEGRTGSWRQSNF